MRSGELHTRIDVAAGGILFDFVKDEDLQPRVAQRLFGALRMAGRFQAVIGDQEDSGRPELASEIAELLQATGAVDDARRRMEVERLQRPRLGGK
jgi:hypothetical protein